jgi:hypothetical protein
MRSNPQAVTSLMPAYGAEPFAASLNPFAAFQDYWIDAAQRSVLLLDALRQRADTKIERASLEAPNVLTFAFETLVDGRVLPRPVNYVLTRVIPPPDVTIDPAKRPFIVFDPRAGHGPGIGGMKQDSEIGVALAAGHPCYFVGFMPNPEPGQTIEDVCRAEAHFLEVVIARHPEAEGKPYLVGNCQAGWQIMMMAAIRPGLPGPIMLAGAPLSYWSGVRGTNPMRYLGGILGGSWLAALSSDLGNGVFDGAHLIANFERMNPANTYWTKGYNVYSKVDTEAPRFLDFETWWGNAVRLNAEEIQFIVDELFVGDKLASGLISTSDGRRVDLSTIRSPIIVLCSWGDDITPPQQALGWLLQLYDTDEEMLAAGQTVVYTVHQSIGHLGIFVSGKVATKEHAEFTSCMELIDLLPPGLFEAVITEVDEDLHNPELIDGKYLFRLEGRRLSDIRALGANSPEDELRFETVARVSEINLGLYRRFLAPMIRAMTTEHSAEALRRLHPHRLRYEMFASRNPLMQPVPAMADVARQDRRPVSADNPFLAWERMVASAVVGMLDAYKSARDAMTEAVFLATYGMPTLQTLTGLRGSEARTTRQLMRETLAHRAEITKEASMETGGLLAAGIRAMIYVFRADRRLDERAFAVLQGLLNALPPARRIGRERFREVVRDQALILRLDEERAVAAIPRLLPDDGAAREDALDSVRRIVTAQGPLSEEGARRLARVAELFGSAPALAAPQPAPHAAPQAAEARQVA